ncbi:MAG: GerMN domain-containing protein [Fimbriimonadaceae bacterium]
MAKPSGARSAGLAWGAIVACLAVVGVLVVYLKSTPALNVPEDQKRATHRRDPAAEPVQPNANQILVPIAVWEEGELKFGRKTVDVPAGQDPKRVAVQSYLNQIRDVLPGVRLEGFRMDGKVAQLRFSAEFDQRMGSDDEATVLMGILAAMGQFPDVEEVEFFAGGRQIETIGNVELNAPLPVVRLERWAEPSKRNEAPAP